jgi:hypothetical protein
VLPLRCPPRLFAGSYELTFQMSNHLIVHDLPPSSGNEASSAAGVVVFIDLRNESQRRAQIVEGVLFRRKKEPLIQVFSAERSLTYALVGRGLLASAMLLFGCHSSRLICDVCAAMLTNGVAVAASSSSGASISHASLCVQGR